jgi:hypothetical protein
VRALKVECTVDAPIHYNGRNFVCMYELALEKKEIVGVNVNIAK